MATLRLSNLPRDVGISKSDRKTVRGGAFALLGRDALGISPVSLRAGTPQPDPPNMAAPGSAPAGKT